MLAPGVSVVPIESRGNGVITQRPLQGGEVVLTEIPLFVRSATSYCDKVCARCLKFNGVPTVSTMPFCCPRCPCQWYCSRECLEKDIHHTQSVCSKLADFISLYPKPPSGSSTPEVLVAWENDVDALKFLSIAFEILHGKCQGLMDAPSSVLENLLKSTMQERTNPIDASLEKCFRYFVDVCGESPELVTHLLNIDRSYGIAYVTLTKLENSPSTGQEEEEDNEVGDGEEEDDDEWDDDDEDDNADEEIAETPERYLYGFATCMVGGMFNHECMPNIARFEPDVQNMAAVPFPQSLGIVFRAMQDIVPMTELTISYLPLAWELKERQSYLREEYNFECTCARCLFEKCSNAAAKAKKAKTNTPKLHVSLPAMTLSRSDYNIWFACYECGKCGGVLAPWMDASSGVRSVAMECNVCGHKRTKEEFEAYLKKKFS